MTNVRGAVAIAVAVVLVACGGSSTANRSTPAVSSSPAASASASPSGGATPSAFPSPSPGVSARVQPVSLTCASTPSAGEHLALVTLRGGSGIIVRDITDLAHPVSRCSFGGGTQFRFYNATHVSYIVTAGGDLGAPGALFLADLTTRTTSLVRAWSYGGYASWVYAWSPDGRFLSYIASDQNATHWHLLSANGDKDLLNVGAVVPRDVNLDNDDVMVGFSADSQYVAIEQTYTQGKGASAGAPPIQVDRVSDGSVVYNRPDGTMAAWAGAGAKLYFRTTVGVQSWAPGQGLATVSAGLSWIHPWASPDGSRMAFSVLNAQQNHVGEVLDLTSGGLHSLSANPRVGAAFLTAGLVWYAGESICTTTTPCGLGGPPLSGQTYIYDLGSDVETGSVDTGFFDSWPHVVGQS